MVRTNIAKKVIAKVTITEKIDYKNLITNDEDKTHIRNLASLKFEDGFDQLKDFLKERNYIDSTKLSEKELIKIWQSCIPPTLKRKKFEPKRIVKNKEKGKIYMYYFTIDNKIIDCYIGKTYDEYGRRRTNFNHVYELGLQSYTDKDPVKKNKIQVRKSQSGRSAYDTGLTYASYIALHYKAERDFLKTLKTKTSKGQNLLRHFKYHILEEVDIDHDAYGKPLKESKLHLLEKEKEWIKKYYQDEKYNLINRIYGEGAEGEDPEFFASYDKRLESFQNRYIEYLDKLHNGERDTFTYLITSNKVTNAINIINSAINELEKEEVSQDQIDELIKRLQKLKST